MRLNVKDKYLTFRRSVFGHMWWTTFQKRQIIYSIDKESSKNKSFSYCTITIVGEMIKCTQINYKASSGSRQTCSKLYSVLRIPLKGQVPKRSLNGISKTFFLISDTDCHFNTNNKFKTLRRRQWKPRAEARLKNNLIRQKIIDQNSSHEGIMSKSIVYFWEG